MNALYLFGWTFALVFAFGFISRGGYLTAFLCTFVIGVAYLVAFRLLPMAHAADMWAYLLGGPFGIVASMAVQRAYAGARDELRLLAPDELDQARGGDSIYDDRAPWRR